MWRSELSANDKKFVYGVAISKTGKAVDIKEAIGMSSNEYAPYRDRIVKNGNKKHHSINDLSKVLYLCTFSCYKMSIGIPSDMV